ncbi:SSU ribosomal protein S31P [Mucilaginibacter mallensis]|uniref:SSU ribosomal protein S31P n=1 Tax=Mucilaginibacter mallensis TaxID=652787 RepID=A0A1H1V380_MUCMA|nr:30S ribosomal protein THX [Mucilaginibacter mallensis]SDS78826.1 SSU ribosomal protein S31P [Mucilaginibacter mallensis]
MGKGDKKSRKGKIAMGSFGKSRPHHVKKAVTGVHLQKEEKPAEAVERTEKAKKPSA